MSIPGVTNQAVLDSLATTAKLDFRPVLAIDYGSPQAAPCRAHRRVLATAAAARRPSASARRRRRARTASASPSRARRNGGRAAAGGLRPPASLPRASPSASPARRRAATAAGGQPPIQSVANDAAFQAAFTALDCPAPGATQGGPADPKKYIVTCAGRRLAEVPARPGRRAGHRDLQRLGRPLASSGGGWEVNLTFTSEGATQFADGDRPARAEAVAAEPVRDHPRRPRRSRRRTSSTAILGGSAVITGSFTADEAKALANVLKYGSLPVALEVSSVEQLSPTLGQDQLDAGLIAGALGLLLVVHLPAALLPGARPRRGGLAARRGGHHLRRSFVILGRHDRVHAVAGRCRRCDRRDRYHRRLVRRLLRTHP